MIQVAAAFALDRTKDYIAPFYRSNALVLAAGLTPRDLMLGTFAKAEDPSSGGRQMPSHYGSKKHRILTTSSVVTVQILHATGVALAAKMKGADFVALTSFGEGSSNQGDFHEALNFASVQKLPVIVMVENNQYSISTPISKSLGEGQVYKRAEGYGIPGVRVDGNDPLAVYEAVQTARARAVAGEGPTLIEAMTYRLTPHSTSDNDMVYRTREEVDAHWAQDGLPLFKNYLIESGIWSEEQDAALNKEVKKVVDDATKYADKAPFAPAESTLLHVYEGMVADDGSAKGVD
jgi:2-oxoisovalerate dehydrogenase E1 component alpha subunit